MPMDNGDGKEENGTMFEDPTEEELIQARSGKVTGIIIPPPEIRAIADKTAQWYVCRALRGSVVVLPVVMLRSWRHARPLLNDWGSAIDGKSSGLSS